MKRSIENCIKVLKLRFADLNVYDEYGDIQVSVNSVSVPSVGDFKAIVGCFFDNAYGIVNVNNSWGFTEAYLSDGYIADKRKGVDIGLVSMFVPYAKHNELKKIGKGNK